MNFNDRIKTIVNYVFTTNIFKPIFEASRELRYKSIEERTHDNLIERDMYGYTKTIADGVSSELRAYEQNIWQPKLSGPDSIEKDTIRIGY
jgi:hypothetical protein